MKFYLIACMVIPLLGGCVSSNAESKQMKQQLDALQGNIAKLELSKEQLIQENQSLKQTIELSSSKIIHPNYSQIRMDSLNEVMKNELSIAHTYQIENYKFISFYEAIGKFLEGAVVTAGDHLFW